MNRKLLGTGLAGVALACLLMVKPAAAAGLLTPVGSSTPLAIKDHQVRVIVEDGYVVTEVEQVFANSGQEDREAVYSFPVPLHGAVAEFTYWIDGQPVTGEVFPKDEARQIYEQEKSAGRETALAEKDEYRTFDISVYPVRAGQDVRTRLVYLQAAHTDTGIGRYVYPLEEGGVDEQRLAFWDVRDEVTGTFSFELELKSSYPVDAVRVPDQPGAQAAQVGPGHWTIRLDSASGSNADFDDQIAALEEGESPQPAATTVHLDKDVVVYWRHQQGLPGSVDLVTQKAEDQQRGTFMLTLTPGDDLPLITDGRDWVFVLDASGSMQGKFLSLAEGVRGALGQLNPQDRFRIIYFNNSARELTGGFTPATPANVQQYIAAVESLNATGGTNLHAGMQLATRALDADRPSGIALVTDGVANFGVTEKKAFLKLLQGQDVRLFTFIMGNSANVPLLEAMTEVSQGFAMTVSNSDDIGGQLQLATSKLSYHAMHDVKVDIDGVRVKNLQPDMIGSVYRGEQLVLMGHYWKPGEATVEMTATVAGQPVRYKSRFTFPEVDETHPELERLWAYRTIEHMQEQLDYFGADPDIEQGITDLAVEFGLVTDYTSMLVVREEVFQSMGVERRNRDRVANERQVRQQKSANPPVSRRVDQQQPMFNKPRPAPGGSGGGAMGLELVMLLLLGAATWRRRGRC